MRALSAMALVAALIVPGCDAVLGIEVLPRGPDPVTELPACSKCAVDSCAPARTACIDDLSCREVYGCVAACPLDDIVCRAACERSHAGSQTDLWHGLDGCRRINCTDECYGVGGFGRAADASCSCTDSICEPFIRTCIRSGELRPGEVIGDCERKYACLADRPRPIDPEDVVSCGVSKLGGDVESNTVRFCWQGASCGTCPMAGGHVLACIDKYQWQQPQPSSVDFTLGLSDQRGRAIVGAKVAACVAADCEACADPVDSDESDAKGSVVLQLPTFGSGFRGCFQVTAPGMVPTLWYPGRPITRNEAFLRVPLLGPEELASYGTGVDLPLDPLRGQVVIATRDCIFAPAAGLTLDSPGTPGTLVTYLKNGNPTREGPTDETGRAGIVNAVPGPVTVILRGTTGEHGRFTVRTRAGWLTGVFVFPNVLPGAM